MGRPRPDFSGRGVALRKESVDRNFGPLALSGPRAHVALRKESVDRNDEYAVLQNIVSTVALRKESVDRNKQKAKYDRDGNMSLSARRAWIEIKKTLS